MLDDKILNLVSEFFADHDAKNHSGLHFTN